MCARAAWSPQDNLSSLFTSPSSFFSWEPLGSLDELFRCCNLPTVAISFRGPFYSLCEATHPSKAREGPLSFGEIVAGKKLLPPQWAQLSRCWFPNHPGWLHHLSQATGKGCVCAHMQQVWSASVSPGSTWRAVPGCVGLAVWWGRGGSAQPSAPTAGRSRALLNGDTGRSSQALTIFLNR